jgi:biopolymer transport protein ExbB
MNILSTVATFYKEGGFFMHAVLVIAVLVVAIILERVIIIRRASTLDGGKLTDDLVRRVQGGDLNGARQLVRGSSVPLASVASAMLESTPGDVKSLQAAGDDAATLVLPDLTRRLSYLGMLANSATLIGLLGTITGLITAISGVGVADAAQRSAYLSAGIAEALHTTAFGLMIAIPTLLVQGWLNGRVEGIADQMDHLSIRLGRALEQAGPDRGAQPQPEGETPARAALTVIPVARDAKQGGSR